MLGAQALGVQRPADGDVAIDGQQYRQPGVRHAEPVVERIHRDEDAAAGERMELPESLRHEIVRRQLEEHRREDGPVGDGERSKDDCRRRRALVGTTQSAAAEDGEDECVADESEDGDRYRQPKFRDITQRHRRNATPAVDAVVVVVATRLRRDDATADVSPDVVDDRRRLVRKSCRRVLYFVVAQLRSAFAVGGIRHDGERRVDESKKVARYGAGRRLTVAGDGQFR